MKKYVHNKLTSLRNSWLLGEISREQYWNLMQQNHLIMREYHNLLNDSDVESIQITSENLLITLKNGIKFYWDPEEVRGSANVLINDGRNEAGYSDILFSAAANKNVIFDIGANVGYYAIHFATELVKRSGHVHAFEPIQQTYERLRANVDINGLAQFITANNIGLSNSTGTVDFYEPDYSGSVAASMKNLHPNETVQIHKVSVETLDIYCEKYNIRSLDLLKIDVEGAEMNVIQGGGSVIKEFRPILFMELLRKWSKPFGYHPNDLLKVLYELGYKCWTQDDEGVVPFEWMSDSTVQTNFILVQENIHGKPSQWW